MQVKADTTATVGALPVHLSDSSYPVYLQVLSFGAFLFRRHGIAHQHTGLV